ncbi:MAG: YiiX/YebB-like N1pC/P60 family cysteine hydrolase, partial [Bdellovibrio bacteriovorus]
QWMVHWLTHEGAPHEVLLSDFARLAQSIRPGDVILVEGRTRIAGVIRLITQSNWTHAALYIGRLHEIQDHSLRRLVGAYYQSDHGEQLLIEALLGEGTRVSPLAKYRAEHLRICRPKGLCPDDAERVIAHAIRRLGSDYDMRQLFDLARFLLPWAILPRRWRSSLFEHRAGGTTRTLCSCLIAEAFNSVAFPVLPFVERREDGSLRFFRRNPRLYTPRDFDYSPYFDVIKYPFLGLDDPGVYRRLEWSSSPLLYSDSGPLYRAALSDARPSGVPPQTHVRRRRRSSQGGSRALTVPSSQSVTQGTEPVP